MAAAEYYLGTSAHELPGNRPPQVYPPQAQPPQAQPQYQQPQNNASYGRPHASTFSTPPPSYAPFPTQPQQQMQMQTYAPPPPAQQNQPPLKSAFATPPYPTGPEPFPNPQIPAQKNGYLGGPLQPQRSHSQPPRVHFADNDASSSDSSPSDTDSSHRRRRRRHHRHDSTQSRSYDSSPRSRDQGSSHSHHRHSESRAQRKEHKDRDTFLGAGVGGLVGDMIIPGLGTAAGLLLGGYGGRKYAGRSKFEDGRGGSGGGHRHRDAFFEGRDEARYEREEGRHRHRDRDGYYEDRDRDSGYARGGRKEYGSSTESESEGDRKYKSHRRRRRGGEKGWDEESATYKSGSAVR